jgi:hypothetical protein
VIIGIVGAEGAKFTPEGEQQARKIIRELLVDSKATKVVSGACHLGGIDTWAIEEGKELGLDTEEFPPKVRSWEYGYKPRNIKIATVAHEVVCITVNRLPEGFAGMKFELCYHCGTKDHIKSGGCWTTKYARNLGKPTKTYTVVQ